MTIAVYTAGESCQQCKLTQRVMTAVGIRFDTIDLTDDANAAARDYVTGDLGYSRAPVVVVDEHDQWAGFQPDAIARLAASLHAQPVAAVGTTDLSGGVT
ncbi:MAG: glutaredoxin domain-containing protein [Microbacterium sp.]|uniref:glutaredoxin domain-containing protein n=1 Tax=Microbacterium sp. TaxID=51671 RepID=UPI003F7DC179